MSLAEEHAAVRESLLSGMVPASVLDQVLDSVSYGSDERMHDVSCPYRGEVRVTLSGLLAAYAGGDTCPHCEVMSSAVGRNPLLDEVAALYWAHRISQNIELPLEPILLRARHRECEEQLERIAFWEHADSLEAAYSHAADLLKQREGILRSALRSPQTRALLVAEVSSSENFSDEAVAVFGMAAYQSAALRNKLWDACAASWGHWDQNRRRVVVVAPLQVGQWMHSIAMPRGLKLTTMVKTATPDGDALGEMVAGVWDPLGDGALKTISESVEAARCLL